MVGIVVTQTGPVDAPSLELCCVGADEIDALQSQALAALVRNILAFDASLQGLDRLMRSDAQVAALAQRYRGLRPPRLPDLFEALSNAVACQQVSLASGLALLSKTAAHLAPPHRPAGFPPPFPKPETVLDAGETVLRNLGWSQRKADYLLGCARAIVSGAIDLGKLEAASDDRAIQMLSSLRGIKRWSAQYVALRGLGRLAVLPLDDVGAHKHLAQWLGRPRLDAAQMEQLAQRWSPAAGMLYFLLLLKRLEDRGLVGPQI